LPSELNCVEAQPDWTAVDFISDLHLQASEPVTFNAWQRYLQSTQTSAIFILGDLFEVWVGDDSVTDSAGDGFERRCVSVLREAAQRCPVHVMRGNRDFLLGSQFAREAGVLLLQDPCCLAWQGQRWLLSHGDALCIADVDYQRFRSQVRSPAWQKDFLGKPLAERRGIARQMRDRSEALKRSTVTYADADRSLAVQWLEEAECQQLIHGHTHRPGSETWDSGHQRHVLSDWDLAATPPRSQVLRIEQSSPAHPGTFSVSRLDISRA
jgi:UDP-2,3-diacylglucosamine hydrolase